VVRESSFVVRRGTKPLRPVCRLEGNDAGDGFDPPEFAFRAFVASGLVTDMGISTVVRLVEYP
jgi:hypothetical protein